MKSKRERILEILNRDLSPWEFHGEEPMAVALIAIAEEVQVPEVQAPDTERIAREMIAARDAMNNLLRWLSERGPEVRRLERLYCEGRVSEMVGFEEWYVDPKKGEEKA